MIQLKNITKVFKKGQVSFKALDEVSLHVPKGKIFGVIGSSGAGKSTLIRCVNLLETPTSGEVWVDGKNLMGLSSQELAKERKQIGMIFQHFNLLSSRTVSENIALALELDGVAKGKIKERVSELLDLVDLKDKANEYPANISGGQKQRVAIARTLANNPKVLLCDEATSALDPATTRSILKLLKDINKRLGITILLITHEMEVVKTICDEVALISAGKLVEQGIVSDVFSYPKTDLAKDFISSALQVDIPELYLEKLQAQPGENLRPFLKLEISSQSASTPVLSNLARTIGVDCHIISSQLDHVGGIQFGIMLIVLYNHPEKWDDAIKFFESNQIKVSIIGYV